MEKLQLSRQSFYWFARNMDDPAYPNDEALLKFLFGTPSAVATFVELIRWFRYSKRADGAIYKSDAQLAKAIGRSPKSIERARAILKDAGFTIFIKKANGAPTHHYLFDLERFLAFLAAKLDVQIEKICQWLSIPYQPKTVYDTVSKSEAAEPQNDEMNSDTMSKSAPLNVEIHSDKTNESLTSERNAIELHKEGNSTSGFTYEDQVKLMLADRGVANLYPRKRVFYILITLTKSDPNTIIDWVSSYGIARVEQVFKPVIENYPIGERRVQARRAMENCSRWTNTLPAKNLLSVIYDGD